MCHCTTHDFFPSPAQFPFWPAAWYCGSNHIKMFGFFSSNYYEMYHGRPICTCRQRLHCQVCLKRKTCFLNVQNYKFHVPIDLDLVEDVGLGLLSVFQQRAILVYDSEKGSQYIERKWAVSWFLWTNRILAAQEQSYESQVIEPSPRLVSNTKITREDYFFLVYLVKWIGPVLFFS